MANFADAIASIESGGRYDILGPVTRSGDRAYGKYQIMGSNVGPWTREVLGRQMTPEEFAADPQAQDAVFQAKFGNYVSKYGPEGAARAWFAGEKGMNDPNRKDILGTSVASYANKFNKATGNAPMAVGMPQIMGGAGPDETGLPPILQQQQAGGLAGLFQDPEKFAALAMIAKGLNPWSEINPQEMMAQAQRQKLAQTNMLYERQKDARDFGFRQQESKRSQDNADRAYKFQESQAGLTDVAKGLIAQGFKPGTPEYAAEYKKVWEQKYGSGQKTDDIKEFEYAKKEEPNLTFQQFMQRKKAVSGEYSLTPIYGTNDKGETVILQPGKSGEAIQTKLPPNVKISSGTERVDAGTHWVIYDKRTGTPIGTQPKNIEEKAVQEAQGEAKGKAVVALPAAEKTTMRALTMLDQLEKHPGFNAAVGLVDSRLPAYSSKMADFRERVEQIDAMVFGDAVEVMRGLGALTDKEGPRITAARARLKTAKSEEDFRTALKDVREVFQDGLESMRRKAGVTAPSPSAAPSASTTSGGSSIPPPPPGFQLVK